MNKVNKLKKQLEAIKTELERLAVFRDTPHLKKFKRQLQGEQSVIKAELNKLTSTKEEKQQIKIQRIEKANKNRSSKNKRVWNYVKSIQKNYRPDLTLKNIRSNLKKHRQGLETDIPDVAWRNPSP